MNKVTFLTIITVLMFAAIGCDETQLRQVDQFVTDANSVVTAAGDVMQSPAGALLPPVFQLYGASAIALASIALNSWQKVRANLMKKTTKAIVKGVESAGKVSKTNPANQVKDSIRTEMILAGVYDKGNQLVDQLKVAR